MRSPTTLENNAVRIAGILKENGIMPRLQNTLLSMQRFAPVHMLTLLFGLYLIRGYNESPHGWHDMDNPGLPLCCQSISILSALVCMAVGKKPLLLKNPFHERLYVDGIFVECTTNFNHIVQRCFLSTVRKVLSGFSNKRKREE